MGKGKLNVSDNRFRHINPTGISIITAMLFLVGEMAGGGVVAMPKAMANAGWYGILIIIVGAIASGWTGIQLGQAWEILQHRWPEFRGHTRNPYPSIGKKAFGSWGPYIRPLVTVSVFITTFGATIVYLILASQNIHSLIQTYHGADMDFCVLMCIIAACLVPLCWLGSPADFWWVSIISMCTSVTACILITVGTLTDLYNRGDGDGWDKPFTFNKTSRVVEMMDGDKFPIPSFEGFALGYGTITFAYGGHSAFPTIQHDMKKPVNFWKSVSIGYVIIMALYLPVAVAGYFSLGNGACGNITDCLSIEWIKTTTTILITAHVIFSFIILMNPPAQEIEGILGIPAHWNWKRMITRTFLVAASLFIAESIPSFGAILDLIGSTGISLNTYVFPGVFLICLRLQKPPPPDPSRSSSMEVFATKTKFAIDTNTNKFVVYDDPEDDEPMWEEETEIPKWDWALNIFIIFVGLCGAVAGTYAAIEELISTSGSDWTPCYAK